MSDNKETKIVTPKHANKRLDVIERNQIIIVKALKMLIYDRYDITKEEVGKMLYKLKEMEKQ